jgi:hypothetical protein
MALSIGGGLSHTNSNTKTTSDTKSAGEQDPWDYSIPYLQDFLREVGAVGGTGLTPDQKYAYEYLKGNAFEGNPWDQQIGNLTDDLFATADRSGQVGQAYGNLQNQLGDYASGKFLDPFSNPQMQAMLTQVGDDASQRINQQFAAAGRDMSSANSGAVARGVTSAQLPLLFDQFNRQQQNQMTAAQALYGAGADTASTQGNLDAQRAGLRGQGVNMAQAYRDARNQGANDILNLDQQIKMTPYEDLGVLGSLLFPVAGLGGQETGDSFTKGTSKTKTTSASLKMGLSPSQ